MRSWSGQIFNRTKPCPGTPFVLLARGTVQVFERKSVQVFLPDQEKSEVGHKFDRYGSTFTQTLLR